MREGLTYPAMPMDGAQPNYFTINGRAYPATDVIKMKLGETLKVRFIGSNTGFIHPMHVHGGPFQGCGCGRRDTTTLCPLSDRYRKHRTGPALRRNLESAPAGEMADPFGTSFITRPTTMRGEGGVMVVIEVALP